VVAAVYQKVGSLLVEKVNQGPHSGAPVLLCTTQEPLVGSCFPDYVRVALTRGKQSGRMGEEGGGGGRREIVG